MLWSLYLSVSIFRRQEDEEDEDEGRRGRKDSRLGGQSHADPHGYTVRLQELEPLLQWDYRVWVHGGR